MSRFNSFLYDLFSIFKPKIIDGFCYVKFRLPPRYRGCLAPFGFDWMRTGDSLDYVVHDLPYKENTGRYFIDKELNEPSVSGGEDLFFGIQPEMYIELRKRYLPGNLKFFPSEEGKAKSYHVPVLSIFPYTDSHPIVCYLSLEIVIKREIANIQFEYDEDLFAIEGIDSLLTERGKHVYNISIKCIKELNQDQYIRVISINRRGKVRKAGILRICKNVKAYRRTMDILLVNVKCLSSADEDAEVFSSKTSTASKTIGCMLQHALITPAFDEIELDLGYAPELTDRFQIVNGSLSFITNILATNRNGEHEIIDNYDDLSEILTRKLDAIKDTSHYDAVIYCFGMNLVAHQDNYYQYLNGYSNLKYVMLSINYTGATAAHELLHTLGLSHTFDNFHQDYTVTKFTYKIYSTDNLMDYTHLKNVERTNLWEWQWEKIREACAPEGEQL